jgi:hypothetical protein
MKLTDKRRRWIRWRPAELRGEELRAAIPETEFLGSWRRLGNVRVSSRTTD